MSIEHRINLIRDAAEKAGLLPNTLDGWLPALMRYTEIIQSKTGGITLNAYQLKQAAEFAAPDYETDEQQRDTEVHMQSLPARFAHDGTPMPAGDYVWLEEYPEEGCLLLEPEVGVSTPDPTREEIQAATTGGAA